jgi:cytochrome c oxidase subunit IV
VAGHSHAHGNGPLHDVEQHAHTLPTPANTLTIFAVLAGLAILALFIGFADMGPLKVVASLACAVVQAGVLAYFFMDLKQSDKLTWLCVGAAIFFTGLQFLFTLTDYLTRHLGVL